jgi:hypothetical protein
MKDERLPTQRLLYKARGVEYVCVDPEGDGRVSYLKLQFEE